MPTATNAYSAKRALITVLAADSRLAAVQVEYSYPGHAVDRELVHAGRAEASQSYPLSAGGRARLPRDEALTVRLCIVVSKPNTSAEECEQRCVQIGTVVEEIVATATLTGVEGLIYGGITGLDLDSDDHDDGAVGVLTYDVFYKSRLT